MKKRSLRVRTARIIDGVVTYLIIALISFIFFVPCIWIVLASFSKSGSIYSFGGFFPSEYSFNSFIKLFTDTGTYDYPLWFGNTFKIAACAAVLGTFLTLLTAYCMSRYRFKGRKAMMKATLVLGMFPSFMSMTAVYLLMTQLTQLIRIGGLFSFIRRARLSDIWCIRDFSILYRFRLTKPRSWTERPIFRYFCALRFLFQSP